jgi:peptide/nickel transport system substrate-binding protein
MDTNKTRRGAITRNDFLRGAGALGLGGMGLLSAPALGQQETPRMGGVLFYNLTGSPPNFDPLASNSGTVMGVLSPCYNGLIRYDPMDPDKIIPDLAESWTTSPDGKIYTFKMLSGVRFHDGKPCTSADAKYTFDMIRNPPAGAVSLRRQSMAGIDAIETPDATTLRIILKRPSPAFLGVLASAWNMIMPKHILEEKGPMKDVIVGTGPFMLKEYVRGVSLEFVKNPNYHVRGRPYLDGLKAFIITDTGATRNYLRSGQLHIWVSIQGQDTGSVPSGGPIVVLSAPSTSFIAAIYNTKVAPFDNIVVRKAASLAIDRDAALKVTYNSQGLYSGLSMPGPWRLPADQLESIPGYGKNPGPDLAEARRLLAQAGHANGLTVKILVRRLPLFEPVAVFLKDQWSKIGINSTIDVQENASYFASRDKREFQVDAGGGSYQFNDPDAFFSDYVTCNGSENFASVCKPSIDNLFERMTGEMNFEERRRLSHQIEREALAEYGIYVMYLRNREMGISSRLRGMVLHPNIDQNMRWDHLWLAA